MDNKKTPWNDVSRMWKKIAGVIAAVGVLATLTVKIFNTDPAFTYTAFAFLGLILLMISWYVDRQASYTFEEIISCEKKAREDFTKSIQDISDLMYHGKDETYKLKEDSDKKIDTINKNIDKLLEVTEDTRKDTLRIQLLMIMTHDPDNVDTILKLAETYFVKLKGDWYMTSEFNRWAKAHDVQIPDNIWSLMKSHID